jgi:hypothetical protein
MEARAKSTVDVKLGDLTLEVCVMFVKTDDGIRQDVRGVCPDSLLKSDSAK